MISDFAEHPNSSTCALSGELLAVAEQVANNRYTLLALVQIINTRWKEKEILVE